MKRFSLNWLYAVLLIALGASAVLATMAEQATLQQVQDRNHFMMTSLEDPVIGYYKRNQFDRIARLVFQLKKKKAIEGLTLCDMESGQNFGFPEGENWESLCEHSLAKLSFTHSVDTQWNHAANSILYQNSCHPVGLDRSFDSHLFLILSQDVSPTQSAWLGFFTKSFLLTWISVGLFGLLLTGHFRSWLRYQIQQLRLSLQELSQANPSRELVKKIEFPITREIQRIAQTMNRFQSLLSQELTPALQSPLRSLESLLKRHTLVVISNREPYVHSRVGTTLTVSRPISGLVTALEPILRHFGGLWIAHGSGNADFQVLNDQQEIEVPPDHPRYTLKRISLKKEEYHGYYDGFANEGLWPLCHQAYHRPQFRLSDWHHYQKVNHRFAHALSPSLLEEDPLILVQDYHLALLPRLLRSTQAALRHPPRIGLFWHIPWPGPEVFEICPWKTELLMGMLGAHVIGFHTPSHRDHFLQSCDQFLEAQVHWNQFAVTFQQKTTKVQAIPIGIDTTPVPNLSQEQAMKMRESLGVCARWIVLGVDRMDYTKGILERIQAIERLLEKYPHYQDQLTLIQIGSPSRIEIEAYQRYHQEVQALVNRINLRFGNPKSTPPYLPILLLHEHYDWDRLQLFYQLGDACLVSSLHDGMNLVAKEYVWCQASHRGSLILSQFAGASLELSEAFIINPYCIEEMADTLAQALSLSPDEKAQRMNAMKKKLQKQNALTWASDLIHALDPI